MERISMSVRKLFAPEPVRKMQTKLDLLAAENKRLRDKCKLLERRIDVFLTEEGEPRHANYEQYVAKGRNRHDASAS